VNWTPLQRETLEAMGLSPYRLASATPHADATPTARATMTTERTAQASVEPRVASGVPRGGDASAVLIAALLRAAGRSADAADRDAVMRVCPSPQSLRGDPRAKRALWPMLRAMRRH